MSEAHDPSQQLSPDQARDLACVLDEIIPPSGDGRLPGAGELGLVAFLERKLRESPDLRPAVEQGLATLARLARERDAAGFAEVPGPERLALLNALAPLEPAFLPGLIFHTYVGYYQSARVLEGLGLEPRPPFPKGYAMEGVDPTRLDAVRRRPPMWRKV